MVSAGQYGMALNQLTFDRQPVADQVQSAGTAGLLPLKAGSGGPPNYPADPATAAIVAGGCRSGGPLGAVPLGKIGGPFFRGKLADGTTENRGTESTLGNLVAEVQKWATTARVGCGADRVHEPGRSAPGHDRRRCAAFPSRADLQAGR